MTDLFAPSFRCADRWWRLEPPASGWH
jgi:hypothetical protein